MSDHVGDAYDGRAEEYAELALGDLSRVSGDRAWLDTFAAVASGCEGAVLDLGCGPGHVVSHLIGRGVATMGYDLSPGLVAQARQAFPGLPFVVADLTELDLPASTVGGIVARYSLIHMEPSRLAAIFVDWFRLLEPGGPVLVSFFAAASSETHGSAFDHAVTTAYALFPSTIAAELQTAGFDEIEIGMRGPLDGERPLGHATVFARKPSR